MIRLVLADDHPIVRSGIAALVSSADDLELVGEAVDGLEAVALVDARLGLGAGVTCPPLDAGGADAGTHADTKHAANTATPTGKRIIMRSLMAKASPNR